MKKIILFLLLTSFIFADLTFDLKTAIKKNDAVKIKNLLEKGAIPDPDTINQALVPMNIFDIVTSFFCYCLLTIPIYTVFFQLSIISFGFLFINYVQCIESIV